MSIGIIGKKLGMTQIFNEQGQQVPVTVIEAEPNKIVALTTSENGVPGVQLGIGEQRLAREEGKRTPRGRRANKAEIGHAKKAGIDTTPRVLRSFSLAAPKGGVKGGKRAEKAEAVEYKIGDTVKVDIFQPGEIVKVTGTISPGWKMSTLTVSPILYSTASAFSARFPPFTPPFGAARLNDRSTRGVVSIPAFFACPISALFARRPRGVRFPSSRARRCSPMPSCTPGTPFSDVVRATILFGSASMTVTGTCCPCSLKIWVMPSFLPMIPMLMSLDLDFDVNARGQIELRQRVHRLCAGIEDIDDALVRLQLELLTRLLVDVRRAKHGPALRLRGQRDGTGHLRARLLRRAHDVRRGLVDHRVVERLETDANSASHKRESLKV